MKMKLLVALAITSVVIPLSSARAVTYNQTDTAIFGSGNPDTGWTVESGGGVTLGLRGKNRTTGDTSNVNGDYAVPTGFAALNRGFGNAEFSVDTGASTLLASGLTFWFGFDTDASVNSLFTYLPLAAVTDSWYGSDSTVNGGGTVGTYALAAFHSEMQNSINQFHLGVNPLVDGTYEYELFATQGTLSTDTRVASVGVTIQVGQGGTSVPDTGSSLGMLAAGFTGLGLLRRKLVK